MVHIIIITPEEYKSRCSEFEIIYGRNSSPFGECLIGITGPERAVCFVWFIDDNYKQCVDRLKKEWPNSMIVENSIETAEFAEKIFSTDGNENFSVMLRGTEFQIKVWKALLEIPIGKTASSTGLAEKIGTTGVRSVGAAIKANRLAYIFPCHRVTTMTGESRYRWGPERRKQIIEFEKKYRV